MPYFYSSGEIQMQLLPTFFSFYKKKTIDSFISLLRRKMSLKLFFSIQFLPYLVVVALCTQVKLGIRQYNLLFFLLIE
jgi:hypothetical protein